VGFEVKEFPVVKLRQEQAVRSVQEEYGRRPQRRGAGGGSSTLPFLLRFFADFPQTLDPQCSNWLSASSESIIPL